MKVSYSGHSDFTYFLQALTSANCIQQQPQAIEQEEKDQSIQIESIKANIVHKMTIEKESEERMLQQKDFQL